MRMFKASLIALACLATAAQTATAAPQPVTFRFTAFGTTVPGLPAQDIGPFSGSFNGGISSFDVYCVDALNNIISAGGLSDFAAYSTRIGVDGLERTRLGNLTPGNGDDLGAYVIAAYIADKVRTGAYSTPTQLAAAQLAMWYITQALVTQPPGVGPLNASSIDQFWGITGDSQVRGQLLGTQPFTDPDYAWEGVINDAVLNFGAFFAGGGASNWVIISDARWSARTPCFTINQEIPTQDNQNCVQEVIAYSVIPEPATMGLMAVGLIGLGVAGARRRHRK